VKTVWLARLEARVLGDLLGSQPATTEERAAVFASPPAGTIESRWHVYTSGYLARLVEAIENDYPAVRLILGERPFASFVARYVRGCPPRSYDVGRVGDRLAQFLEADPLTEDLPFLPDLARLEWALAEAFVAPDEVPLSWDALRRLTPEAIADLPLALHPSAALVRSRWPILALRECHELPDEAVAIPVVGRPVNALVYRQELEVMSRAADDAEADLLARLRDGATLASLGEQPGAVSPDRLTEMFRAWVAGGLIVSYSIKGGRKWRYLSRSVC
jgi:hypothetical protein